MTSQPLFITVLRQQCDSKSQKQVGIEIGYSAAVVNQVLRGRYLGDITKVERAVRGAYMGETVACPILGELPVNLCMQHQQAKFAATNPNRVALYRACNMTCQHGKGASQ